MTKLSNISGGRQHKLKCHDVYFDEVKLGLKTFEVRKNDRFFQCGDSIILERYVWKKTGWTKDLNSKPISRVIGPVLQGGQFGLETGYCAFSLFKSEDWEG
tara:strand:- start:102 stop:404 length:303 start_codon:yes stop_codon:yes gene_type:complete